MLTIMDGPLVIIKHPVWLESIQKDQHFHLQQHVHSGRESEVNVCNFDKIYVDALGIL